MTYWRLARAHLLLTNEVLDIISHSNFLSISSQIKATESVPNAKWPSWSKSFSLQGSDVKKSLALKLAPTRLTLFKPLLVQHSNKTRQ